MVLALSLLSPALELTALRSSCCRSLLSLPCAIFLKGKPFRVTLLRWLPVVLPLEAEGLARAREACALPAAPAPHHP